MTYSNLKIRVLTCDVCGHSQLTNRPRRILPDGWHQIAIPRQSEDGPETWELLTICQECSQNPDAAKAQYLSRQWD